jgi:L,D-transpeptidase ErfK/SrfK
MRNIPMPYLVQPIRSLIRSVPELGFRGVNDVSPVRTGSGSRAARALGLTMMLALASTAAIAAPARQSPVPAAGAQAAQAGTAVVGTGFVGEMTTYTTVYEDTLLEIARRHHLGYVEMAAANPDLDPWVPGAGKQVVIPGLNILPAAPHEGIVINVGEMRLYYYASPNAAPETYPIGIGREGKETPKGSTTIVRKMENPTWYPTAGTRKDKPYLQAAVGPGPDNPLGDRAMYLGWPAYLIHGTNNWMGIGRQASRGCIRMYPEDIQQLFPRMPVGTKVTVVNQPVKLAWANDQLFIEIHPDQNQADEVEATSRFTFAVPEGFSKTILAAAGSAANRVDWEAVRQAAKDRKGYPVRITM